jgi:16S rRNA (cytidine1402-2'-O)-methyltransferase
MTQPLQAIDIQELPRPAKGGAGRPPRPATQSGVPVVDPMQALLTPARQGHDLGLLSEAGLPAVADPGAMLVAAAHRAGVPVRALPGPSSLLLALAASGLEGQCFAFVGYLPQDAAARAARIRELELASRKQRQTQIAIETPYRNPALLRALLEALSPATRLSVSIGLTLPGGWTRTDTVAGWRANPRELSDRTPAVFAWLG